MRGWPARSIGCYAAALAMLAACTGKLDVTLPGPVTEGEIEPVSVATSLAKVKGLLTGLPPTDAEIQAVQADPNALRGLVQQWIATPQHTAKLLGFFSNAFQQSQSVSADFNDQLGDAEGSSTRGCSRTSTRASPGPRCSWCRKARRSRPP